MHNFPAALLLPQDAFDTDTHQVMGRRVAGRSMAEGLTKSLTNGEQLTIVGLANNELQKLGQLLQPHIPKESEVTLTTALDEKQLAKWGCLHLPDPGLMNWSILRSSSPGNSFSLTGIIHTLCSHGILNTLEQLLEAPLHPWDALVCTSNAGRSVVLAAMASKHEKLQNHFRVTLPFPKGPELPIIPLAINPEPFDWASNFPNRNEQRVAARKNLELEQDRFIVLFVGRLSFHCKAHPEILYRVLDRMNRNGKKVTLLECGHIYNSGIENAYKELNKRYPHLTVKRIGGLNQATQVEKETAFAAADVFCSLADNLQETFGISILEAMAAELPVVASNWNGYKDLILDGQTGWLIPTSDILEPYSITDDIEKRYRLGIIDYDTMVGLRSLSVIVAEDILQKRLEQLEGDKTLCQKFGQNGKQRIQSKFSWKIVANQYRDLWNELTIRREHSQRTENLTPESPVTSYGKLFAHYSSSSMPNGPFYINSNPSPERIMMSSMQANFLRYWCGNNLEELALWINKQSITKPKNLYNLTSIKARFSHYGINEANHKKLLAALIKLGILYQRESP